VPCSSIEFVRLSIPSRSRRWSFCTKTLSWPCRRSPRRLTRRRQGPVVRGGTDEHGSVVGFVSMTRIPRGRSRNLVRARGIFLCSKSMSPSRLHRCCRQGCGGGGRLHYSCSQQGCHRWIHRTSSSMFGSTILSTALLQ